jgi:adenylate kinase
VSTSADGALPLNLVFLGPAGAGKGTQAKLLAAARRIPHISTGDILRAAVKAGSPLGREARAFMDDGKLVPDAVMCPLVAERIRGADCAGGFILDGFPRTTGQAEALEAAMSGSGIVLRACVYFDLPIEVAVKRTSSRLTCNCGRMYNLETAPPKVSGRCDNCGETLFQRADDTPDAVRTRMVEYERRTSGLVGFYRDRKKLVTIDASGSVEEVSKSLVHALGPA